MKKYDLLLKYLNTKICTLGQDNLDAYDQWIRQTEPKDHEDYNYTKGTYMGFDNAMKIITEILEDIEV